MTETNNMYANVNMDNFTKCKLWPVRKQNSKVVATGYVVVNNMFEISIMLINGSKGLFVSLPRHQDPRDPSKWYDDVQPVVSFIETPNGRIVDPNGPNVQLALNHYVKSEWERMTGGTTNSTKQTSPEDSGDQTPANDDDFGWNDN